jgi:septal ring factor EnvC (AmiA/AmiB activator)
MATAMTMTIASSTAIKSTAPCCPNCGVDLVPSLTSPEKSSASRLLDAQKQIEDLQTQVRLLNEKAAAAVDRWADYEDELARLRTEVGRRREADAKRPSTPGARSPTSTPSSLAAGAAKSITSLLSPRPARSTPNLKTPVLAPAGSRSPPPPAPTAAADPLPTAPPDSATSDLLAALNKEQSLRKAAENTLQATSREVEELSVQLFEQANEMVASERRARAKLEERVEMLEKRDVEKRRRLERLESAMGRIERVRAMLGDTKG